MMRRLSLLLLALVGGACGGSERPVNVLLISIDSLRADHLASYGYERQTSPRLDRLAAEGVLFETVVAESSWTLPTHASIFTGLTSGAHGVDRDNRRLAEETETLGSLFREAGYRTRGIYSAPYLHPTFGFGGGFAEGDWTGVGGSDPLDTLDEDADRRERRLSIKEAHGQSHRSVTSPEVTEQAESFLAEVGEEPFFLFLHYFDVHFDYVPPAKYWRKFDPDYRGGFQSEPFLGNPAIHPDMPAEHLRHVLARYDGEILWVDEHIGRVLDALEARGLADDTLVVVTSDHGDEFFEHGATGHRHTLYDEVLLVPLIARQPGRTASGHRVSEVVRHIDILPTVLDWAGLDAPASVMGVSLAPALRGEGDPPEVSGLSRLYKNRNEEVFSALRGRDWKLLRRQAPDGESLSLIFDLERDPGELEPMPEPSAPELSSRARRELEAIEALEALVADALERGEQEIEVPAEIEAELRALGYVE